MSSKGKLLTALVLGLLLLAGVGYYFGDKKKKKFNWYTNYKHDNAQPYGAKVLHDLLGSYFPNHKLELNDKQFIKNYLSERKDTATSTYFLLGDAYYTPQDISALIAFAEAGNTLFLSTEYLPDDLFNKINRICPPYINSLSSDDNSELLFNENFVSKNLKTRKGYSYYYQQINDTVFYTWNYFDFEDCKKNKSIETLAIANNKKSKPTFIKIPVGKGQMLLHANPIEFTNLHLLRKDGIEYAGKIFSHLPEGPIIWDKYSTLWKFLPSSPKGNQQKNPLGYILNQRSFKWAYYTIWVLVIVFVLFNLWRKQRAIPPKFANTNTSLEFMKSVGELYFKHKDNQAIGKQKMDFFLKTIRQKYYIKESDTEKLIEKLSKKSEVDIAEITAIFKQYETIKNRSEISDGFLYGFYKNIENFKKKSK